MRSRSDKCIWILMRALVAIAIIVCAFIAGCERNRRVAESKVDVAELVQRTARTEQLIELSKVRDAPVYNASLTLSDSLDQFDATVRITYTNRANKPLSDMVLHVYPNSRFMVEGDEPNIRIEEILVDNRRADYKADHAILRITLPRELAPNKRTVVTVRYRARVPHLRRHPSDLIGMLTDAFQDLMSGKRQRPRNLGIFATADGLVSLGLWYPVVAIYGDDGWDTLEPSPIGDFFNSEISHFNVRITTPRDVMVVTTGIDGLPRAMGDGEYEYFYNTAGAVRDFSIQCSRKFEAVSTIAHCGSGTPVRVTCYFLPNRRAPALHALKIAAASLEYYSDIFIPYPYREMDVVEAPLAGVVAGVEYPGLICLSSSLFSASEGVGMFAMLAAPPSGDFLTETLEFVTAHEVAHQWWHAIVGSDSKRHPFVDEALANYSALLFLEQYRGKDAAERQLFAECTMQYLLMRALGMDDRPVDLPCNAFSNMLEYCVIVYGKGALFLHALRSELGTDKFISALREYAQAHRFGRATPEDLINAFAGHAPQPKRVHALAQRWLHETHGDEDIGTADISDLMERLFELIGSDEEAKGLHNALKSLKELFEQLDKVVGEGEGISGG